MPNVTYFLTPESQIWPHMKDFKQTHFYDLCISEQQDLLATTRTRQTAIVY